MHARTTSNTDRRPQQAATGWLGKLDCRRRARVPAAEPQPGGEWLGWDGWVSVDRDAPRAGRDG
jgi:hypothetical protein